MISRILYLSLCLPVVLFAAGCTTDPVFEERSVSVSTNGLPPLDATEGHYELWFSYPDETGGKRSALAHGDAEYISMGTFIVASDGTPRSVDGGVLSLVIPEGYNPNLLIDAILTVESPGDADETPASRFLSGTFAGSASRGEAVLTLRGLDAFGIALDSVNLTGEVRLTTPSTASTEDEMQGIWFIDALNEAGLGLRPHPINLENELWTYEAWLTRTQGSTTQYISLGRFDNPAAKDVNGAGPNAGPDPVVFDVPGEDFVVGSTRTLNDGTYGVVVSLQPEGPNVGHPFYPLVGIEGIPLGFETNFQLPLKIMTGAPTVEIVVQR